MKRFVFSLLFCIVFSSGLAHARSYDMEYGKYFKVSHTKIPKQDSRFFAFRYRFEDEGVIPSISVGGYKRGNLSNHFISFNVVKELVSDGIVVEAFIGPAYIRETTDRLSSHLQFYFGGYIGKKVNEYEIKVGFHHLSNGSYFFGTPGPNMPEEYLTFVLSF